MPSNIPHISVNHSCQYREQMSVISVGVTFIIAIALIVTVIDSARNIKK